MKKKESLYIANADKAKTLDDKRFEQYLKVQDYVFAHFDDQLKANTLLTHAIDELKAHDIDTSHIKTYVKHLEKEYPIKEEMRTEINRSKNNMSISLIWITMSSFIVLMFIKEALTDHFLIHLYIDSAIAVVAFYVMLHQLHMELNILNMNKMNKRPFIVSIVSIIAGLIINVLSSYSSSVLSKFDFSFLILVIGMLTSRRIFEKQFNKK